MCFVFVFLFFFFLNIQRFSDADRVLDSIHLTNTFPASDICTVTYKVRETVIGLIKWSRPKGLKVCSYVEMCAEFKNQTLKNRLVHISAMRNGIPPGVCNISK